MDPQPQPAPPLASIPADRRLVEALFSQGLISSEGRNYALQQICPPRNWNAWVSRLLLIYGAGSLLSGLICFFAFNWNKIPPLAKLGSLQVMLLSCLAGALWQGLEQLRGKILLLAASVLVGIFMAVFGQIYQTGADAWNLFVFWAVLILPWTLIGEFSALWMVWLAVANTAILSFFFQYIQPERDMKDMIFVYCTLFNTLFLLLREYLLKRKCPWIINSWFRPLLITGILAFLMIPAFEFFLLFMEATFSMQICLFLSLAIHTAFYILYRYRIPDMKSITCTVTSGCLLLFFAFYHVETRIFRIDHSFLFLIMGIFTQVLSILAFIWLRSVSSKMMKGRQGNE